MLGIDDAVRSILVAALRHARESASDDDLDGGIHLSDLAAGVLTASDLIPEQFPSITVEDIASMVAQLSRQDDIADQLATSRREC